MTLVHWKIRIWGVLILGSVLLGVPGGFAQKQGGLRVQLTPQSAVLTMGDTAQFSAKLVERNGTEIDTVFTWSVDATGFGEVDSQGLFTASAPGRGQIYASIGNLSGKAHITVKDTGHCDSSYSAWSHLEIAPQDTLVLIGETIQYHAFLVDSAGIPHDTTVAWQLRGNTIGELTETGFFSALDRGVGLIRAMVGRWSATTRVLVSTEADTASPDSIHIRFRDRDGIQQGILLRIQENDVFLIKGLAFPLNVLNGGEIVFPPGCLTENIEIQISLSETAKISADSVSYLDQILNGIVFQVLVDGVVVSPYYFPEPVQLVLPYKEELLTSLGLTADDLWVFFYDNASSYTGDGISNVVVDTVMNKIYADVIHFSDLVIGSKALESTAVNQILSQLPETHRLHPNYPNPFNPETKIVYVLGGQEAVQAELTVYNVRGQRVCTLVDALVLPGEHKVQWDGCDAKGQPVPSGIYIYRLKAGSSIFKRRMLLLK